MRTGDVPRGTTPGWQRGGAHHYVFVRDAVSLELYVERGHVVVDSARSHPSKGGAVSVPSS